MTRSYKKGIKVLADFLKLDMRKKLSWNMLMQVVEKLESLDLSEMMYKWEDSRGMNYNFQAVSVHIEYNKCYITIDLELDPPIWLNDDWTNKQHSLGYKENKIDAVFWSLVEAVQYLKENELI